MALATQCPHCQTTFRVAHDQLKLRAGLVRCGACQEIFNGIEHLLRSEPVAVAPPNPIATSGVAPTESTQSTFDMPVASTSSASFAAAEATSPTDSTPFNAALSGASASIDFALPVASPVLQADDITSKLDNDPLTRMTLMHFNDEIDGPPTTPDASSDALDAQALHGPGLIAPSSDSVATLAAPGAQRMSYQSADELDQAIDYLQRKPWRRGKKNVSREDVEGPTQIDPDALADEPNFVSRSRTKRRQRRSVRQALMAVLALLVLGSIVQGAYFWRDQLAARAPVTRPTLEWLCLQVGCRVGLPAQIDAVSIESNELVSSNLLKNNFVLTLLLRNRATLAQRWPAIELTLLDVNDKPLLRRVFEARDYLPSGVDAARGFTQNSEQNAKVTFELVQQKAANYRVYLFYP